MHPKLNILKKKTLTDVRFLTWIVPTLGSHTPPLHHLLG
jgi:hypothetical protein